VDLAAAYALLGKTAEAKPYLEEALRLNPKLTVKWSGEHAEDVPARSEGLQSGAAGGVNDIRAGDIGWANGTG
jgi:tetratricopeptide (TPR) repeat protein